MIKEFAYQNKEQLDDSCTAIDPEDKWSDGDNKPWEEIMVEVKEIARYLEHTATSAVTMLLHHELL